MVLMPATAIPQRLIAYNLIETAKLSGVDTQIWLTWVLGERPTNPT